MSPIALLLRLAQGQWPPPNEIETRLEWFRKRLEEEGLRPRTIQCYLQVGRRFLSFLSYRSITLESATPADLSAFIERELVLYRRDQGRLPQNTVNWRCGLTHGIHYLLRLVQGKWPPPRPVQPWLERLKRQLEQDFSSPQSRAVYLRRCTEFLTHLEALGVSLEKAQASHVSSFNRTKLAAYRKRHGRLPRSMKWWKTSIETPINRLVRLVHGYWPPESRPDPSLERFRQHLTEQHFSASVIPSMMSAVRVFLRFLQNRSIPVEIVTPEHLASYLGFRLVEFQRKHKRCPRNVTQWRYDRTGSLRRYLRFVRGRWPEEKAAQNEAEAFRRQVCASYGCWLTDLHGFSPETLRKNGHAAGVFLEWLRDRGSKESLRRLTLSDLDAFLAWRNQGLRRATRRGVSNCLRSFLHFLYAEGFIERDLSVAVSSPTLYRFESIPSAFTDQQVERLLDLTRKDRTALGLRDHAILLLVATYGLRAGEVVRMKLEDIDWRRDRIRLKQSKTRAELLLPLTPEVGEAILNYLRRGRPKTHLREIFIRARAPHGSFTCGSSLYTVFQRRIQQAGIQPEGKRGPHAIRYARATSLLRASVPLKSISDLLGHRSAASTEVYLKLATEDLRSVALDVPGEGV
ncbi:MAG: tyrosine-type recombinase/integrase [Acidobacteria bacterium]|nr:tyrosine-type recombinase/integrase [Acidobacteriota bacterium]